MPLYTDQGYYYSGGTSSSSQLYAPYYTPGLYTIPSTGSSGGSYAPYSSVYNRSFGGNYILPLTPPRSPSYTTTHSLSSRYQPKLSTITETSPLISSRHVGILPLTRIQSPKVISSYSTPSTTTTTKYVAPRPIPINTADIDVSSSRYQHHKHNHEREKQIQQYSETKRGSAEKKQSNNIGSEEEVETQGNSSRRSTIKRNRPVVRLSTIRSRSKDRSRDTKSTSSGTDDSTEPMSKMFKDLPTMDSLPSPEIHLSWREKLAAELAAIPTHAVKKSPGDLIRERYLIQNALPENICLTPNKSPEIKTEYAVDKQLADDVVLELNLDQANKVIRHLSIPQCPSFHDICEDISSDKIDDDLNAGELRRRASLIQEQEQELLNQLQKSASGSFQLIHLERRDSQDSTTEESHHRQSTKKRKSKKGKKIKHKITAIVEVDNAPHLPVLAEREELSTTPAGKEAYPKPKFTFNIDSVDEHHEISKVLKLPKRKSVKKVIKPKENILPEGFMQASPKTKAALKPKTPKQAKSFINTAEIFTFEPSKIELMTATETPIESVEENLSPRVEGMTETETPNERAEDILSPKVETPVPDTDFKTKAKIDEITQKSVTKSSTAPDLGEEKFNIKASKDSLQKSKSLGTQFDDSIKNVVDPKTKSELPKTNLKTIVKKEKSKATESGLVSPIAQKQTLTSSGTDTKAEKDQINEIALRSPVQELKKNAIEKSDSGEDFWAQIGNRESVYMTNRKKGQLENQWSKRAELLEPEAVENASNVKEIKSAVTAQKKELPKEVNENSAKDNEKKTAKRSQSTESFMSNVKNTTQKKELLKKANQDIAKDDEKITAKISQSTDAVMDNTYNKNQSDMELASKIEKQETTKKTLEETEKPFSNAKQQNENSATTNTPSDTASPTSATTKINFGQTAKSPAQQANKLTKQADNEMPKLFINEAATTSTILSTPPTATTTTTTTPKTPNTPKICDVSADKNTNKAESPQVTGITETTTKLNANDNKKPETDTEVDIKLKSEVEIKSPPISAATPTVSTQSEITGAKPKIVPKTKATTTTKTTVGKSKTSPGKATSVTPLNADGFISFAPPKSATSPTKQKTTSPKNAKPKAKISTTSSAIKTTINSDVNEKKAKTKTATKAIAATVEVPANTPQAQQAPQAPQSPALITTSTTTTTTTTTNVTASNVETTAAPAITATTTTTKIPIPPSPIASETPSLVVATELLANHKSHEDTSGDGENNQNEKAHAPNNLSKFATVQNLAQCLQDVDADLEDYIPSSAENSDDEDSLYDYSSTDGCDYKNLSASMKKKLRQQRKKEKQAEQARFDPQKKVKIDTTNKCYVKEEAPRYPLVATPRPLWKREKIVYPVEESDDESGESDESGSGSEEIEDSEECTTSEEYEDDLNANANAAAVGSNVTKENSAIIRLSTCSNDSGFEGGTAPSSPKKMLGAREARESPSTPPSSNPAYTIEANDDYDETSYTYSQFQKSGRFTAPATVIPRFKNYSVDDFHFLAVLGKGSFGKVLLAELRDTTYYYAVKCLKKDVVLEDDDVDSTLIERKVLALGTKHPYLCHLFCTFQTESHLFFVMEYLNGGDLMFHIQESGRFSEERARFYGAEIISGLKFLHKKGIIYRDLKLDNVLLDYEGHVRIADFGMCKLQIYLDKTADSFCGTPDYMAPEIIKGEKYNQNVDWWSFGVLLYEMLIGQSPFSGCDEDELFWSICNEIPWFPVYISAEATGILKGLLEKDYTKRIGSQYSPAGDISDHLFFRPIDWDLLEKRQLPPPFKPLVKHPLDTQYFDRVFTKERVRLTPIEKDILQSMDQKPFLGFTYTNPHITLD